MEEIDRLAFRYEIARKAIHLSSLSISVLYYYVNRELTLFLLVPLFSVFFLVDILKNFVEPVSAWYYNTFDAILRTHEVKREKKHLNGATFITMSALLLVFFFPKVIAIVAFSMVAVSDTLAAIVGKFFGKHRFGRKSIEGSVVFFISAIAIVIVVPGINLLIGFVMAAAATVTEAFVVQIGSFKIDDNLTIPLFSATVGTFCYMLFMPEKIALLSICH
ncbi:MAG: diacylglycerol/polyprenol kinase family protein [Chlorobiaceae bacterium]